MPTEPTSVVRATPRPAKSSLAGNYDPEMAPTLVELSYLLGDDSEGLTEVFGPRLDVDRYVELIRQKAEARHDALLSIRRGFKISRRSNLLRQLDRLSVSRGAGRLVLDRRHNPRNGSTS